MKDEQIEVCKCRHCFRTYRVDVPKDCCPICFLETEMKKYIVSKNKWTDIKRLTYCFILVFTPMFIIGIIYGHKIQLLCAAFLCLGIANKEIISWLMKKF